MKKKGAKKRERERERERGGDCERGTGEDG